MLTCALIQTSCTNDLLNAG